MSDDVANTTAVETETDNATSTETVLTAQNSEVETEQESAPATESASRESGDTEASSEDTGEGSQTAPETYADFTMPEGVELDSALLGEAAPLFKELNLTQEQAQKLVDFQAKQVQAGRQSQVDTFNQLMQDWQEQSKNDKEFGGEKFDENIKVAKSAIEKFGTPELKQLLEDHGVGNHPEVIRFMFKVGKLTQEDVPGSGNPTSKAQDRVSLLYPNDKTA